MHKTTQTLIQVVTFACTLIFWSWILQQSFSTMVNLVCIVGTIFATFPTVVIGRQLLDRRPSLHRVEYITSFVHAGLMLLFGTGIIMAIKTNDTWQGVAIPISHTLGITLFLITGAFLLLTVVNLALRGLGAPFAISLSRRLATDWLYSWTRNPMALALLSCLVALGLWLQSTFFIIWILILVTPAWLVFLKVYEERELELRFGEAYRTYKSKTSFILPKKPRP